MAVLVADTVVETPCDDCSLTRVVATVRDRDAVRATILAGCPSCEGHGLTIPR